MSAIVLLLVSCASAISRAAPQPSATASLDPALVTHLQMNNETFDRRSAPGDVPISRDRAIALAQTGLAGKLTGAPAEYGQLHGNFGQRADRAAWLVVLEGVARPAPPGGPAPVGRRRTFVFLDAEDGRGLTSFPDGAGPPP